MMKTKCNQCPRKCNAIRTADSNLGGFCKMPNMPVVARAALHYGEEPCISGEKGSGTVFFSGCNLKCVYCQNYEISTECFGERITVTRLAEIFKELENSGANNINLVNPSHYISSIKQALNIYRPNIPIVYNSSSFDSLDVIKEDIFDIYLLDLKYISSEMSKKYSAAENYFEIASKVILQAYKNIGESVFNDNAIMQKGLIVRHLLLPLATNEALMVIDWFVNNTPNAYFSLMSQYTPFGRSCEFKEINRKITKREYDKVCDYLLSKNIKNAFIQDLSSATKEFIPEFNGFGVRKEGENYD